MQNEKRSVFDEIVIFSTKDAEYDSYIDRLSCYRYIKKNNLVVGNNENAV